LYTFYISLKNALSILLLFTWTLFQYNRMQSYLQCPLDVPLSGTPIVRCDCERQVAGIAVDNPSSDTGKSVAKPRPDEVFTSGIPITPGGHYLVPLLSGLNLLLSPTPAGFTAPVFQPPRG
jgi:hypothetical protein